MVSAQSYPAQWTVSATRARNVVARVVELDQVGQKALMASCHYYCNGFVHEAI